MVQFGRIVLDRLWILTNEAGERNSQQRPINRRCAR